MDDSEVPSSDLERRKQVKLRVRTDLSIKPQKYEGRTYYVVKDPVSLRYYRFKDHEHYLLMQFDGQVTMDQAQKNFEKRFRPERLTLEDLEQFAQQLMTVGLAQNDSPQAGQQLYEHRAKRRRTEMLQTFTNVLYIKIPIFDPEKLLIRMLPYCRFIFSLWFFAISVCFMLGAIFLLLSHFETFMDRLPSYQEFFNHKTLMYMWAALGITKVIHEFGHGLSCKHFGGEVHEMGFLLLCLSPAMYCNVSDAWTMPNKWHRIVISFAGIYVELMIAAAATFIWWNSSAQPFVQNMSLALMVVCSVNTVVFNGNPLMRFDGYYVLADWLEIPNLRERSNRYLQRLAMEYGMGVEVQPEPYMDLSRRCLFLIFAVVSWVYRWVITFVMLKFLATFLKPYKLEVLSTMLAIFALGSMLAWPLVRMCKNIHKRGRLPDMKAPNVTISSICIASVLLGFFFLPLPVSRVRQPGLVQIQEYFRDNVSVEEPGVLKKIEVREGQLVIKGQTLAEFTSLDLDIKENNDLNELEAAKQNLKQWQSYLLKPGIDPSARNYYTTQVLTTRGKIESTKKSQTENERARKRLVLKAPRAGVVMNLPSLEKIGEKWDKDQPMPFCTIGDPRHLYVVVPLAPYDYDLVRDDLEALGGRKKLAVTIRIQGRGGDLWHGIVAQMPAAEAKSIPVALSSKGGGPLATKPPSPESKELMPQNQVYLVGVDILDSDEAICPGALAQVKIHCRYRSAAWWAWRTISATFDIGLL
jgi:putative peptide zinc metalloprotease protein